MTKIYTPLEADEAKALLILSLREKRDPRQQAALLIRCELQRLGLLSTLQSAPLEGEKNDLQNRHAPEG